MANQTANNQTDNQTINIQIPSKEKIASKRTIIPFSFALAIICFFLSFCVFSCGGHKIGSVTGINLVTGTEITNHDLITGHQTKGEKIPASMWAIIAFGAAIVGLVIYLIKEKREALIGTAAGAIGFLSLIFLQIVVNSSIQEKGQGQIETSFQFGYWLALLAFFVAGLVSYFRIGKSIKITINASSTAPLTESSSQPMVEGSPSSFNSSFDLGEWLKKYKKIVGILVGVCVVLFGLYYFFLKHDPETDGRNIAIAFCDAKKKNIDETSTILKKFLSDFDSYKFSSRQEIDQKLESLKQPINASYQKTYNTLTDKLQKLKELYITDREKSEKFEYAFSTINSNCNTNMNEFNDVNNQISSRIDSYLSQGGDSDAPITFEKDSPPKSNNGTPASSSIDGIYPQASQRLLNLNDISGLSKSDLRIMRNEIFARHGYIFKTNDMKDYFNKQPWYRGQYTDVTSRLSNIEKQNVELIKKYE